LPRPKRAAIATPGPLCCDTDSELAQVVDAIRSQEPASVETLMREHPLQLRGKLFGLR